MTQQRQIPQFAVVPGAQVHGVLSGNEKQTVDLVAATYRVHGEGDTVNPPSYFLRFPDRPSSRIIALPASVGGGTPVDGIKWISSFPENVAAGLPRASAVLVLNDPATGYPIACLESSIISAARTAASAALAADRLSVGRPRPRRVGFIGTGLIARHIHTYLARTGWEFDEVGVHDLSAEHAAGFRSYLERADPERADREQAGASPRITVHGSAEELVRASDLVVLATVAAKPHLTDPSWFSHNPVVLNVSLRDLAPEVLLASANVLDDVEHCLKAETSPHLTEQLTGNRDFIDGTLHEVMAGKVRVPTDRPVVFSPFGLGVLDLAVGRYVYDELAARGELAVVDGFFHELDRYGRGAGQS
ncbi:2,3-diaminopropionate biosynthesis protein SbnB [Kitasatospora xanthocidica]|uniref:2,3-diaminopropionate biosynthesis protein SbnB n=1 Tax=Kitasatospora xanthocidica TaxID=83382 RepID=A0A372ZRK8_9ACTN|nr:2,3-diaminopropionate biosynthesis protein SbnB [Kitasatospora xanthocidica]RGD58529.1 2,3-diaminopropionate biosynthesis protein SbnB [Kitasatospora xanthocidica]